MKKDAFASAITTILVVSDIKRSTEWYTELLGAELYRAYGGDSVVLQFLGQWLLLVTSGGPTPDKPATHFNPPKVLNDVSHAFTLRVDDCDSSYALLSDRGVEFITPPIKNGAETRCFFRDPDGHLFEISAYAA
ncbi:MAG: VOC family protein [Cryomorphaceae bacterium]